MTFRISLFEVLSSLLLLGVCLTPVLVWGSAEPTPAQNSWALDYGTPEIEFAGPDSPWAAATPGRHPEWLHFLLNKIFKWDPQDQGRPPQGKCALGQFTQELIEKPDPKSKTATFNRYYSQCEDQYVTGLLLNQWQAIRMFSMSYNIDEHPFQHRVVITLPDGKKIKGLLALKDEKKRPLVILRMGISGNIEEAFAEKFFYYQLFERGLFHLLMVENMTSTDFIHNNKNLEFGGIAEAYQNIWLAQLLRSPRQPLSRLVESLHLMGISLGGQGVLTAAWLAPYQKNQDLFQSFLALCPLVNLRPTFDFLFKRGLHGFAVELWAHSRFQEVRDFRPELFESYFGLPHRILKALTQDYKRPDAVMFQVNEPEFIAREKDFFKLHELSTWDPALRSDFWIWVTNEDSIVPVSLNTDKLPEVEPLRIPGGNHCSFPAAWDGRVTQALFRGHILGATDFRFDKRSMDLDVDWNGQWDLQEVSFQDGNGNLEVILVSKKKQTTSFRMSLTDLDFKFQDSKLTEAEKRMIRRWLSTNLTFGPRSDGRRGMTVSWPFVKP